MKLLFKELLADLRYMTSSEIAAIFFVVTAFGLACYLAGIVTAKP